MSALLLLKGLSLRTWAIGIGIVLLLVAAEETGRRFVHTQRELGRRDVRVAQLDSSLRAAQATTARVDTVYRDAKASSVKAAARADSTHHAARETLAAMPDTVRIPVVEVREILDSVIVIDSLALHAATTALAAADSVIVAERREKLLYKTKAETLAPTIIAPPDHKWRRRAEHGAVIALATALIVQHVRR